MDARSARNFAPYLRRMPELTGAQQAAAIHLGHFPARNIGRDSDAVRRVASRAPVTTAPTGAGRLIPSGTPLGQKVAVTSPKQAVNTKPANAVTKSVNVPSAGRGRKGSFLNDVARTRILAAEKAAASLSLVPPPPPFAGPVSIPQTTVAAAPSSGRLILPRMPVSRRPSTLPTGRAATPSIIFKPSVEEQPKVTVRTKPLVTSPVQPIPSSTGTKTGSVPAISDFSTAPKKADPAPAPKPREFDLGAVVGSIKIPESEQKTTVTPVDLTSIKPPVVAKPKAKAKTPEKSSQLQYPARNWVQIATGGESRFKGDVRNYARKHPKLFKGLSGWSSPWSKSHRLVVGPFDTLKAARSWEARFRKAGGDGFVWQSPKGREVKKLK